MPRARQTIFESCTSDSDDSVELERVQDLQQQQLNSINKETNDPSKQVEIGVFSPLNCILSPIEDATAKKAEIKVIHSFKEDSYRSEYSEMEA